jgi:fatty acid synthase subunit alpha
LCAQLHGAAKQAAQKAGVKNVAVSISYTEDHASAFALASL